MKHWLFIIALMGLSCDLLAEVSESILPQMNAIYTRDLDKKINAQQKKDIKYAVLHEKEKLKIMTYNMLYNLKTAEDKLPEKHRWDVRKSRLIEFLIFSKAHLISSQELQEDQINEITNALGSIYQYYGMKTRENEGRTDINAIFYNPNRLELLETKTIPYQDKFAQNAFTFCYFKDKLLDKKFVVINTKLTWGDVDRRLAEAKQLNLFAKNLPSDQAILLMGDFNMYPFIEHENNLFLDGNYIEKILTQDKLKDAKNLSIFGHFGPLCSITNSKKNLEPFIGPELNGFILDHIFVNHMVKIFTHGIEIAKVNGEFPSDHFPVIADIFLK